VAGAGAVMGVDAGAAVATTKTAVRPCSGVRACLCVRPHQLAGDPRGLPAALERTRGACTSWCIGWARRKTAT